MRPAKLRNSAPVRRPNNAMPSGTTPICRFTSTGCVPKIKPEDFDSSRTWREQASQHLDGRGFSCAVRAQKPEELPRSHAQVNVVDRHEFSEAARQPLSRDGRCDIHLCSNLAYWAQVGGAELRDWCGFRFILTVLRSTAERCRRSVRRRWTAPNAQPHGGQ